MKTKLLSLLLTLCLLASALSVLAVSADTPTDRSLADAVAAGVVALDSQADFDAWADYAVRTQASFAGVTVKLNTDVSGKTWTPLVGFAGTFDGNGHTVSGYAVTGGGFFASLAGNAVVQHVVFEDVRVTASGVCAAVVAGKVLAGASVTLRDVTVKNAVIDTTDSAAVGGLVGDAEGTLLADGCSVSGEITATALSGDGEMEVGGVVGYLRRGRLVCCVNEADVTVNKTGKNANVGGIVGKLSASPQDAVLSRCANFGAVTGSGAFYLVNGTQKSMNVMVGGLVGTASVPITVSDCLSAGDVYGPNKSAGLVAMYTHKTGSFTNCIVTGKVHAVQDEYSNGAFLAQFKATNTDPNQYILFQSCYYLTGLSSTASGKTNGNAAVTQYNPFGSTQGNLRVVYPARNVDFTFVGGTSNVGTGTYAEHQLAYNAMFNDPASPYYTGACLATADALWGMAGRELLMAAGYSFGDVWLVTTHLPIPTGRIQNDKTRLDTTAEIVYKGYQAANDGTNTVRFIAGIGDDLDYARAGFELTVMTPDGLMTSETALETAVVYRSLTAGGVRGAIKASDLGCSYLAAVTLTNFPADAGLSVTPYLRDAEGNRIKGTTVMLAVEDGQVVSQYALRPELADMPYTLLGEELSKYVIVVSDDTAKTGVEQQLAKRLQAEILAETGLTLEIKTKGWLYEWLNRPTHEIIVGDILDNPFYDETHGALDYTLRGNNKKLYVGFGSAAALNDLIDDFRTVYGKETASTLALNEQAEDRWGVERAEGTDIRVMTSNTLVISWDSTGNDGTDRMKMLAETYNLFRPDFVGLQENNEPSRKLLKPYLDSVYAYVDIPNISTGEGYFPILYRTDLWRVEECGSGEKYGEAVHPWGFVYVLFSRLDNPSDQVLMYNLHYTGASNTYPGFRHEVAEELNAKIKEMSALYPNAPVIVTGDYNAQRSDSVFTTMYDGLPLETSFALTRDTNLTAASRCIDHISVGTNNIEVLRHRCLDYFSMSYTSDHYPYIADLRRVRPDPIVSEEREPANGYTEFVPFG